MLFLIYRSAEQRANIYTGVDVVGRGHVSALSGWCVYRQAVISADCGWPLIFGNWSALRVYLRSGFIIASVFLLEPVYLHLSFTAVVKYIFNRVSGYNTTALPLTILHRKTSLSPSPQLHPPAQTPHCPGRRIFTVLSSPVHSARSPPAHEWQPAPLHTYFHTYTSYTPRGEKFRSAHVRGAEWEREELLKGVFRFRPRALPLPLYTRGSAVGDRIWRGRKKRDRLIIL